MAFGPSKSKRIYLNYKPIQNIEVKGHINIIYASQAPPSSASALHSRVHCPHMRGSWPGPGPPTILSLIRPGRLGSVARALGLADNFYSILKFNNFAKLP